MSRHFLSYENFNESLAYTDIFGKPHSHNEVLQENVRNNIVQIIVDTAGISEKDFSRYDVVIDIVTEMCSQNPEIYEDAQQYYDTGKRLNLYAEIVYENYFSCNIDLLEESLTDVKGEVERSHKLKDMKELIIPMLSSSSRYDNGRVFNLSGWNLQKKGSSLGADKNGFFCYTHRARSTSYKSPDEIPAKVQKFIESTG